MPASTMAAQSLTSVKDQVQTQLIAEHRYLTNDLYAITPARKYVRGGENLEVWHDDRFVYRLTAHFGTSEFKGIITASV